MCIRDRYPAATAEQLFAIAAKTAFDAFGYRPQAQKAPAELLKERANAAGKPVPNLGDIPAAAAEPIRGNETFGALDGLNIDQLEDSLARMSDAQRAAYLADAPGATATGRE